MKTKISVLGTCLLAIATLASTSAHSAINCKKESRFSSENEQLPDYFSFEPTRDANGQLSIKAAFQNQAKDPAFIMIFEAVFSVFGLWDKYQEFTLSSDVNQPRKSAYYSFRANTKLPHYGNVAITVTPLTDHAGDREVSRIYKNAAPTEREAYQALGKMIDWLEVRVYRTNNPLQSLFSNRDVVRLANTRYLCGKVDGTSGVPIWAGGEE